MGVARPVRSLVVAQEEEAWQRAGSLLAAVAVAAPPGTDPILRCIAAELAVIDERLAGLREVQGDLPAIDSRVAGWLRVMPWLQ